MEFVRRRWNELLNHHRRELLVSHLFSVATVAILLFLWLPLVIVIFLSFAENSATLLPFEGFTLDHYQKTFANDSLFQSFWVSIQVATASATIATILGVLASFGLVRKSFRYKEVFRAFTIMPLVIPGVIFGIALLIFFKSVLRANTGFLTLVLTHSVYGLPFVVLPVSARLYSFDRSVEEAARDLGADTFDTFVDITFPIISPAIGAGFLFAWIRSFEDFIRAFFVSGALNVLTINLYSTVVSGFIVEMNAMSTFILLLIGILLAVAMNLGNVTGYVAGADDDE